MRAILKVLGVTDRKVWAADSYEGLPASDTEEDKHWDFSDVDYYKVSLETVKKNFEKFDLFDNQVEFSKGWFCDTLPDATIDQIAVLRIDVDMYGSTMDVLRNLYHRVSKGGMSL